MPARRNAPYLEKVFMDATDPIVIEDLEGNVVDLNHAAEADYGWRRDEFVGQPIKRIVPQDRYTQADDLLRRCRSGEEVRNVEGVRISKSGERYDVLLTLSLLKDDAGQPMAIASFAKDISELRRLQEAQRREQESVIESQARTLSEMATPVTELWDGILLLPVLGIVDSRRARDIMDSVLEVISESKAETFILDISGVAVMDTAVANHLVKVSRGAQLMGCECVISGLSPAIAQTLIELGVDVGRVRTTSNLRDALGRAFERRGLEIREVTPSSA